MNRAERGFTIIEVMLFLAVTGALFAFLMLGVNTGITQQRYLDSVRSYKALLQNQYSEVINTRNDNADNWKCGDSADGSVVAADSHETRGTSRCVILGRAIQIKNDGRSVVTSSVTGYEPVAQAEDTDDSAALKKYQPKLASFDSESTDIDWEAHLTSPVSASEQSPSTVVILILRSPVSGLIKVYASPTAIGNATDVSNMIQTTGSSDSVLVKNCLSGDSGLLPKQMIIVDPRVASPDAVSTDGGQSQECQS